MAINIVGLSTKLKQFLASLSFTCDATGAAGTCQLVMLRGCKRNANNSLSLGSDPATYTDRYDDTLVAFGDKSNGTPYLATFQASAKPGLAWIKHSSYAASNAGCPTVQPGQYKYVRGDHRGHEALRQEAGQPVVVIRDLDDDARLESTDLVDYPMSTGINIHAGGSSSRVGLNSSGCQVVWGGWEGEPWKTLHSLVYKTARQQTVFHYAVLDFALFAAWHDDQAPARRLLYGSKGALVTQLQRTLERRGYFAPALVDGVFGRGTDRAVRAWQKSQGVRPSGIVEVKD